MEPYRRIGGPDGHLANLRPFKGNTMTGITGDVYIYSSGRESSDVRHTYETDKDTIGIVYTVKSYATVIAWVRADGIRVIPSDGYSVTTARQQNMCRAWLRWASFRERGATVDEAIALRELQTAIV
jgi:hypothetical protein